MQPPYPICSIYRENRDSLFRDSLLATFQRDHASRVSSFSYIQCELKGLSLLENKKLLWFLNEKCKIIRSDFTRLNVTFFTINQRHLKDYFIKIAILNCYLRSVLHASRRQYMTLTHSKLILKSKNLQNSAPR